MDVRVYSFTLILSVDYLLKIAEFFTSIPAKEEEKTTSAKPTNKPPQKTVNTITEEKPSVQMTINLKIEMPDIVLVEHMDNINTNAMILNVIFQMQIHKVSK